MDSKQNSVNQRLTRVKPGSMLLLWGWLMSISYLLQYFVRISALTHPIGTLLQYLILAIPVFGLLLSLLYLQKNKDKPSFADNKKVVWVWVIAIACMSLINMILWRVTNEINLVLQHPIFMAITAFGIIMTGILKQYQWVIYGGIFFGILAYIAAVFPLDTQILFEAVGWLIAFVIPGHRIFSVRDNN